MRNNTSDKMTVKLKNTSKIINTALIYLGLILAALVVIFPFAIILITSFKTARDATSFDFTLIGAKDGLSFQGYEKVFEYTSEDDVPLIFLGFLNTMFTSLVPTLVSLFVAALAAFAFAKIKFRLKNLFFDLIVFTMMIPGTILLVPHFMMYESFGWINTFTPLIIPGLFGGASTIFFLRQFMYGIPDSLMEAGKIDGLGWFGIFVKIMLPLIVPALLAQGLLGFIAHYNAYLGPMLYLQESKLYTMQLVVANFNGWASKNYPAIMACSILTILPILILYAVFQKYFVEGIATTGLKL
ncbi:MAG: carbohydrate ABC transporter permease [Clostridia bacterium]|nr:carbohydrate ABC transporter permease [Clostridia bacterium]